MEVGKQAVEDSSSQKKQEDSSKNQEDAAINNDENATNNEEQSEVDAEASLFPIYIVTCGEKRDTIKVMVGPSDNIQDIRTYLFDMDDTRHVTTYNLYVGDRKINDYSEIADNTDIVSDTKINMKEEPYDERGIRLHIRHTRELLLQADRSLPPHSATIFNIAYSDVMQSAFGQDGEANTQTQSKAISLPDFTSVEDPSLKEYYEGAEQEKKSGVVCYKSLSYSGWNPAPGYRKLQGDLVYIEVATLENRTFYITGSTTGFFVNLSTQTAFDPRRDDKYKTSHSLVGLLKIISPLFTKNYAQLSNLDNVRAALDSPTGSDPVYSWVASKPKHTNDVTRAEDQYIFGPESDVRGQLRDWNEEYQSWKDLPQASISERIVRDRGLDRFHADFVAAATKGAMAVVEKSVQPLNPLEPEKTHMYLYNNIFFSYALDGRDLYKEQGGDRASYMSINNDLKGVRLFNAAEVSGIHTLATVIVDYRGHRVCAQSIIPGILQQQQASTVVYGTADQKKVQSDPKFHEVMTTVAEKLHIKEHTIIDSEGAKHKLACTVESKGIVGTDGRKYILDLVRTTPRDLNFKGVTKNFTLLRPELIENYIEYKQQEPTEETVAEVIANGQNKDKSEETPSKSEEQAKKPVFDIKLNNDIGCDWQLDQTEEETQTEEQDIMKLCTFLTETLIPMTLSDFTWYQSAPSDGQSLCQSLHNHGINIRYLGYMAEKLPQSPLKDLLVREMLTRGAKHALRKIWRESPEHELAKNTAHFLNCFLGEVVEESTIKPKANGNKKATTTNTTTEKKLTSTTASVWDDVSSEIKERFQYTLQARESEKSILKNIATLRSLCKKVGLQILMKDYELTTVGSPFNTDDILDIFPITKSSPHECGDAQKLFAAGKQYLNAGRVDVAHELIAESVMIQYQVYGPAHRETGAAYQTLASILVHAKNIEHAVDHQQKAIVILERATGLDSNETAQAYASMAMLCHKVAKSEAAIVFMKRFLFITYLMSGPNHPELCTIYNNLAIMLQDVGKHEESLLLLKESLRGLQLLLGADHPQIAPVHHGIAMAHFHLGQYKEALANEKKNYTIIQSQFGDKDFRTQESSVWLQQFTAKAVQSQIEAQKQNAPKLNANKSNNVSIKPDKKISKAPLSLATLGDRSLDEIVSYISGMPAPSLSQRNQQNRSNPSSRVTAPPSNGTTSSSDKKKSKKKAAKKEADK